MRVRPRARWVVGATVLALAATACGGGSGGGGDNGGGAVNPTGVVVDYSVEPQRPLVPGDTIEQGGNNVVHVLFTGLVDYDTKTGQLRNQVAQSIESPDSQHFTVKLKPGWTFTNGEPVTAKSFVDAWNYTAYAPNAQRGSDFFAKIQGFADVHPEDPKAAPTAKTMSGLKVVDDHTFTITLTTPFQAFRTSLGYAAFDPLPQAFYQDPKAFGQKPIGDGPYMMTSAWQHNVQIQTKANPNYQGVNKPQNGGVTFKIYQDTGAAYLDLQASNVDVMDNLPPNAFATFRTDLGNRAVNQPALLIQVLDFPMTNGGWSQDDPKSIALRQAISMSIDRNAIVQAIFHGTRTAATGWVSPGVPGGKDDVCGDLCQYNPAKAKQLLAQAGGASAVPGGKLGITYNADSSAHKPWIDAVCSQIQQNLGINCAGTPLPTFAQTRDAIQTHKLTSMWRAGWQADYPDIQDYLEPVYLPGGSSNDQLFNDPTFNALCVKGEKATTPEESIKYYQQAEKQLAAKMPGIPIYYQNASGGYSKRVKNVVFDVFGEPDLSQVQVLQ